MKRILDHLLKRRHWIRFALLAVATLILLTVFQSDAFACPNCKDAVANESHDVQQGYALSILLMMGTPFAIMAGWTWVIVRACRLRKTVQARTPQTN